MSTPALAENVKGKGRHYKHPETGQLLPSVTNVLQALSKPALPRWAAKVVAEQAVAMRDSLPKLDAAEAVDLLKGAPWRTSTRAAARGTSVHEVIEAKLNGMDVAADDTGQVAPWVRSVDKFLAEHEVVPTHTEATLFGDGYAGTCDFVGTIDGAYVYADWKTGKDLYAEVALQLSALAAAPMLSVGDGQLAGPMAPPDQLLAVLFTESGYKVKQVQPCPDVFMALLRVWEWQNGGSPFVDAAGA
jgi:hypothetical protein